jgi:hypothetical protein
VRGVFFYPLIFFVAISTSVAEPQKFTLALPDSDGRISLGVFNAERRLIRVLEELTDEADLESGLNGAILTWDGKDQEGKPVAGGSYTIQGWFVPGDLVVEGEAFYFNSWHTEEQGVPAISAMLGVVPSENGEFWLVAKEAVSGSFVLWQSSADGILKAPRPLPDASTFLAGGGDWLVLAAGGGVQFLNSLELKNQWPVKAVAAAIHGTLTGVLSEAGRTLSVGTVSGPVVSSVPLPESCEFLSICGPGFVVGNAGSVWFFQVEKPVPIPLGDPIRIQSLAPGADDSFWLAGFLPGEPEVPVIRNYALSGELLREVKLEDSDPEMRLFPMEGAPGFYLLSQAPGRQTLRAFRPVSPTEPGADGPPPWEIFFTREVEACEDFGFKGGKPVGKGAAEQSVKIHLAASALNPNPGSLNLRFDIQDSGVWLVAADGLKLFSVWDGGAVRRAAMARGEAPDSVRLLIGQPGYVAGFSISGLRKIVPLDAGTFEVSP